MRFSRRDRSAVQNYIFPLIAWGLQCTGLQWKANKVFVKKKEMEGVLNKFFFWLQKKKSTLANKQKGKKWKHIDKINSWLWDQVHEWTGIRRNMRSLEAGNMDLSINRNYPIGKQYSELYSTVTFILHYWIKILSPGIRLSLCQV